MGWRQNIKGYLTFGRKDRTGIMALLLLLALIYVLPKLFSKPGTTAGLTVDSSFQQAVDTLQAKEKSRRPSYNETNTSSYSYEPSAGFTKGELFTFDPNTLPVEGWKRLGLNERTARTINNYRNKGGKFYKPEDLKKIWGLPDGFYDQVAAYIQITSVHRRDYADRDYPATEKTYSTYERRERKIEAVDVNAADTAAYIALPGIGSRLAYRITSFRDKLGGFYSVDQIGETYGLPDSTFQKIKPYLNVNAAAVRKININTATKDELKAHPYIRWNIANAIAEYRSQHGSYKSLQELKNIVLIDEAMFNKISPYLTLD